MSGVEIQSNKYAKGLSATLPAWRRPLPFEYESTGIETHFTNGLDPSPRARHVFAFHRPSMLAEWLKEIPNASAFSTSAETASPARGMACRRVFYAKSAPSLPFQPFSV